MVGVEKRVRTMAGMPPTIASETPPIATSSVIQDRDRPSYRSTEPTASDAVAMPLHTRGTPVWTSTANPNIAKELGLANMPHDRAKWIEVMVENPILIERPILVTGDGRAAVGRPTEDLKPLL